MSNSRQCSPESFWRSLVDLSLIPLSYSYNNYYQCSGAAAPGMPSLSSSDFWRCQIGEGAFAESPTHSLWLTRARTHPSFWALCFCCEREFLCVASFLPVSRLCQSKSRPIMPLFLSRITLTEWLTCVTISGRPIANGTRLKIRVKLLFSGPSEKSKSVFCVRTLFAGAIAFFGTILSSFTSQKCCHGIALSDFHTIL